MKLHAAASSSRSSPAGPALDNRRGTPASLRRPCRRKRTRDGTLRDRASQLCWPNEKRVAALLREQINIGRHADSADATAPSWHRARARPALVDRRAMPRASAARANVVIPAVRALVCAAPSARDSGESGRAAPGRAGAQANLTGQTTRGASKLLRSSCAGPRRTARQRESTLCGRVCQSKILGRLAWTSRARVDQRFSMFAQSECRRVHTRGARRNRPPPSIATLARSASARRRRRAVERAAPSGHCPVQSRAQVPSSMAPSGPVVLGEAARRARLPSASAGGATSSSTWKSAGVPRGSEQRGHISPMRRAAANAIPESKSPLSSLSRPHMYSLNGTCCTGPQFFNAAPAVARRARVQCWAALCRSFFF